MDRGDATPNRTYSLYYIPARYTLGPNRWAVNGVTDLGLVAHAHSFSKVASIHYNEMLPYVSGLLQIALK
jgi:hypothetical protein